MYVKPTLTAGGSNDIAIPAPTPSPTAAPLDNATKPKHKPIITAEIAVYLSG